MFVSINKLSGEKNPGPSHVAWQLFKGKKIFIFYIKSKNKKELSPE